MPPLVTVISRARSGIVLLDFRSIDDLQRWFSSLGSLEAIAR
jgi:hypothetical protein